MAISYTWDVSMVDVYPSHTDEQSPANTESNVIYNVHWRLIGEDDSNNDAEGNPQTANMYDVVSLDVSDLSSFTDFASVTPSDIQGWVESALGSDEVTSIKSKIDALIQDKVAPSTQQQIVENE
jgi:hypothetical protein|tara:strand:+ start:1001 stop:1372 length:372 start_codon:yes stop_codon:yes gene_type:complete